MSHRLDHAREVREKVLAYIHKYPGKTSEDIAYNNIRINREMVTRTLRYLRELKKIRSEGSRQCARFYPL